MGPSNHKCGYILKKKVERKREFKKYGNVLENNLERMAMKSIKSELLVVIQIIKHRDGI